MLLLMTLYFWFGSCIALDIDKFHQLICISRVCHFHYLICLSFDNPLVIAILDCGRYSTDTAFTCTSPSEYDIVWGSTGSLRAIPNFSSERKHVVPCWILATLFQVPHNSWMPTPYPRYMWAVDFGSSFTTHLSQEAQYTPYMWMICCLPLWCCCWQWAFRQREWYICSSW